jgi:hypothetical protein
MKKDALQKQSDSHLAAPTATNFLQVIADAARDPNVDIQKMSGLLDIQERLMNKQAEMSFNNALNVVQGEMPTIKKDGKLIHGQKLISTYASYEQIDRAIRELLIANGFSLRYDIDQTETKLVITGILSHKDGHSISNTIPLPVDTGGAKSNVQAVKSTLSYGKRCLIEMLLNLVFEGEDDDGKAAGYAPISTEQAAEIKKKLMETDADVTKFLELVGAKSVDEIAVDKYALAMIALNRKAGK